MHTANAARIGEPRDWPLVKTYEELGLGFDELDAVLLDKPSGWDEQMARRLARATHAVISNVVGSAGASRRAVPGALRALAGMTAAQILQQADDDDADADAAASDAEDDEGEARCPTDPSPWPEWADAGTQAALRDSSAAGWGSSRGPWRRLSGRTFAHVRPAPGKPSKFTIENETDFAAVDQAYLTAKTVFTLAALLPIPLLAAFVPPSRTLNLDDLEQPLVVEVPSAWQLVAQLIVWGPARAQERLIAWIASQAEQTLPPRIDRPEGGPPSSATMADYARYGWLWFLAIHEMAPAYNGVLNAWQQPSELDMERVANGVDVYMDRTAIPLPILRRGLVEARASVEALQRPDGSLDAGWFRHLRFLVALGLSADLACRPSELSRIRPTDVRWDVAFDDPETGLRVTVTMVRITPAVKGRRRGKKPRLPQPQWKPIHAHTAADLRLWLSLNGIAVESPRTIWPVSLDGSGQMDGDALSDVLKSFSGGVPRIPRLTGRGYTADNVRHLCARLARGVGWEWIRTRPDALNQVSPYAFPEALLCHQPQSDMLGYMDVKRRPEVWGARAALGCPGVPGTLAMLHEDTGARLGWDIAAIQRAVLELEVARTNLDDVNRRIAKLELDDRELRDAPIEPRVPSRALSDGEAIQLLVARDAAREHTTRLRDGIADELKPLNKNAQPLVGQVGDAKTRLESMRSLGRTKALDDREPLQFELDATRDETDERAIALDEETWEQALERAQISIGFLLEPPAGVPEPMRHILNLCEWAGVLGMTDRAVRDRLSGRATPMFPLSGPDSPVVGEGKLRGIDVRKLSDEFKRRLLDEQREMIDGFTAVPMGSTRFGGRRQ